MHLAGGLCQPALQRRMSVPVVPRQNDRVTGPRGGGERPCSCVPHAAREHSDGPLRSSDPVSLSFGMAASLTPLLRVRRVPRRAESWVRQQHSASDKLRLHRG